MVAVISVDGGQLFVFLKSACFFHLHWLHYGKFYNRGNCSDDAKMDPANVSDALLLQRIKTA